MQIDIAGEEIRRGLQKGLQVQSPRAGVQASRPPRERQFSQTNQTSVSSNDRWEATVEAVGPGADGIDKAERAEPNA